MAHTAAHLNAVILVVTMYRVGVRYKIPNPPTSLSPISLNGFCGRKAPCSLPDWSECRHELSHVQRVSFAADRFPLLTLLTLDSIALGRLRPRRTGVTLLCVHTPANNTRSNHSGILLGRTVTHAPDFI